jgi:hypothetical protein
LHTVERPLNAFGEAELMPGVEELEEINESYR